MIESLIPHPWHLPIWFAVVAVACLLFCGAIRWRSALRFTTAVIVLAVGFALGAVSSFAWPSECVAFPRVEVMPVVAVIEVAVPATPPADGRLAPRVEESLRLMRDGSIGDPRWLARYEWDVHEPESPHPPVPAP